MIDICFFCCELIFELLFCVNLLGVFRLLEVWLEEFVYILRGLLMEIGCCWVEVLLVYWFFWVWLDEDGGKEGCINFDFGWFDEVEFWWELFVVVGMIGIGRVIVGYWGKGKVIELWGDSGNCIDV